MEEKCIVLFLGVDNAMGVVNIHCVLFVQLLLVPQLLMCEKVQGAPY